MENAVDIMEAYMLFCQETLMNHKKIINMKISAVSSFYIWSMKRGFVKYHPFDGKLDRMKKANEEQILNHYFLMMSRLQLLEQIYIRQRITNGQYKISYYLKSHSSPLIELVLWRNLLYLLLT